jgi:hypothetical protein
MHRLVLVAALLVSAAAHADATEPPAAPDPPPPVEALFGWVLGGSSELAFGALTAGRAQLSLIPLPLSYQAGLSLGRTSFVVEDTLAVAAEGAWFTRVGGEARVAVWRHRGPWALDYSYSCRGGGRHGGQRSCQRSEHKLYHRTMLDAFVEAGPGEQWISASQGSLSRRDLELGAGVTYGVDGEAGRDPRGWISRLGHAGFYARLRVLVASAPPAASALARCSSPCGAVDGGMDVGVLFDVGLLVGASHAREPGPR